MNLIPATITVSGHPSVPALAAYAGSVYLGRVLATEQASAWLTDHLALRAMLVHAAEAAQAIILTPGVGSRIQGARCHRCNGHLRATDGNGHEVPWLGPARYCPPCQAVLERRCTQRHGRLPTADEFFCRWCQAILPLAGLYKRDPDGRRRWRCYECRKAQNRKSRRAYVARQAQVGEIVLDVDPEEERGR